MSLTCVLASARGRASPAKPRGHVQAGSRRGGGTPPQHRDLSVGSPWHPPTKPLRSEKSTCRELLPAAARERASRKSLHFQTRGAKRKNDFTFHEQRGRSRAERSLPCAGTESRRVVGADPPPTAGHPSSAVRCWGPPSGSGNTRGHTARCRGQPHAGGQGGGAG